MMLKTITVDTTTERYALDAMNADTDQIQASDDDLLAQYLRPHRASRDQEAFEILYERHKGPVDRFFLRQLPPEAANDAFQETWTKLIASAHRYQAGGKFRSYLFTIAYNVLHDWQRKQMRNAVHDQSNIEVDELESDVDVAEAVAQAQLVKHLHLEVNKLPITQRAAWLLKQESGLGLEEIAQLTNTTLEGVKSRIRYANAKLKSGMQKYVRS